MITFRTVAGDVTYSPDDYAPVKTPEGIVRIRARDINNGAMIFVNGLKVKDLEGVLNQNFTYRSALGVLFESDGKPRFQSMLFSSVDARSIDEYVSAISPHVSVSPREVRAWLAGEVIAPKNWGDFESLAVLNGDFQPIFDSRQQSNGFHFAYSTYVGARSSLGRTLSSGKAFRKAAGSKARFDYAGLVADFFYSSMASGSCAARVLSRVADPQAVASEPLAFENISSDLKKVQAGEYLLTHALYDLLNVVAGDYKHVEAIFCVQPYFLMRLLDISPVEDFMFANNVSAMGIPKKSQTGLETAVRDFSARVSSGEIDEKFGFAYGTFARTVDLLNQFRSSLPRAYFDKIVLGNIEPGSRREAEDLRRQKQVLDAQLEQYGILHPPKSLLLSYHMQVSTHSNGGKFALPAESQLVEHRKAYYAQGIRFFYRYEVDSFFRRQSVPDILKIFSSLSFIGETVESEPLRGPRPSVLLSRQAYR